MPSNSLKPKQARTLQKPTDDDGDLFSLIEELGKVDLNSPLAEQNENSISDNNGGRIEL